jgi:hypothetical protein
MQARRTAVSDDTHRTLPRVVFAVLVAVTVGAVELGETIEKTWMPQRWLASRVRSARAYWDVRIPSLRAVAFELMTCGPCVAATPLKLAELTT